MIYRKEMNERSPLRVFERSLHGGLGKGNIGVVLSRAGVGKTAFLIGVALDDLLRGRKVLHVTHGEPVDHVREFYDEVFMDLARSSRMENLPEARLNMERNRMIHSFPAGRLNLDKLRASVDFLREHAHFSPDMVIVDGIDMNEFGEEDMALLKEFAAEDNIELWIPVRTHRHEPVTHPRGYPNPAARFEAWISVMVQLKAEANAVTVRLIKDHENQDVTDLHMKLDPTTLLLLVEE